MRPVFLLLVAVFAVSLTAQSQAKAVKKDSTQYIAIFSCSMHPAVQQAEAGKCSQCGMALTKTKLDKTKLVKQFGCTMHADVVSDKAGNCSKCGKEMAVVLKEKKDGTPKTYSCPMHVNVTSNQPGKCSQCGMALKEERQVADQ